MWGSSVTAALVRLATSGGAALVGFLQSGTGAVARTIQSVFREKKSAMDFGATGDGVTDDTAAMSAFFAALTSGDKGVVPPGTYLVAASMTPGAGDVLLRIDGTIQLKATTDLYTADSTSGIIEVSGLSGVKIRGRGVIDCNARGGSKVGYGVSGKSSSHKLSVKGVHIRDAYRGHVSNATGDDFECVGVLCDRETNPTVSSRESITTANGVRPKIQGNTILGAADAAIGVHPNSDGFSVTGNIIEQVELAGPAIDLVGKIDNGGVCMGNQITVTAAVNQASGSVIRVNNEASAALANQGSVKNARIAENNIYVETGAIVGYGIRNMGGQDVDIVNNTIKCDGTGSYAVQDVDTTKSDLTPILTENIIVKNNTIRGWVNAVDMGGSVTNGHIYDNDIDNCTTGIYTAPANSIGFNTYRNVTNPVRAALSSMAYMKKRNLQRVVFSLASRPTTGVVKVPLVNNILTWTAEHAMYVVGFRAIIDAGPSGGNLNFNLQHNGTNIGGATIQFTNGDTDLDKIDTAFTSGMELLAAGDTLSVETTVSATLGATVDCYVEAFYFPID